MLYFYSIVLVPVVCLSSGASVGDTSTWGDHDTIAAFAYSRGIDVIVHCYSHSEVVAVNGNSLTTEKQAHIAYDGAGHYYSVEIPGMPKNIPPEIKLNVRTGKLVRWKDT